MMPFNKQWLAAEALAATLKKHHEYRAVEHDGSRVRYTWKNQKIVVNFDEETK